MQEPADCLCGGSGRFGKGFVAELGVLRVRGGDMGGRRVVMSRFFEFLVFPLLAGGSRGTSSHCLFHVIYGA